ncbi:MAG: YceI family protein [Acidobacteria bacterium]|nr:MAG: YceI family protein [Acidobacteriota bacterium]
MLMRFTFAFALVTLACATLGAQGRPIDAERSTLTVFAYKSGLFSAFADDHIIRAPIAGGSISDEGPLAVEITVRSADLVVLDPALSPSKRAEVQTRMVGPEVLDVTQYPEIRFASTAIEPAGADRWMVKGTLTIHGATRPAAFAVARQDGRYRGSMTLKQSEFGIRPISIVGGTVKVKDELKVEFDIVPR